MNAPNTAFVRALALGCAMSLAGCAATNSVFEAMERSVVETQKKEMSEFPDQKLLSVFVQPDVTPAPGYLCNPCNYYFKKADDPRYFLTIDRKGPRVHDINDLVTQNTLTPIESSDAGKLFLENARSRGNTVAVYGVPVNEHILKVAGARQPGLNGALYINRASSAMVEVDATGAFVSIMAVGYEFSRGVIVTDSAKSKDFFTQQRLFVLPFSTARFIQERMPAGFSESYRIR